MRTRTALVARAPASATRQFSNCWPTTPQSPRSAANSSWTRTIRRFARAARLDKLLVKAVNRTSLLDGYTEHLTARFHAGTTDAVTLHAELQAMGFTGSVQTVRRYLHPLRLPSPRLTHYRALFPVAHHPRYSAGRSTR